MSVSLLAATGGAFDKGLARPLVQTLILSNPVTAPAPRGTKNGEDQTGRGFARGLKRDYLLAEKTLEARGPAKVKTERCSAFRSGFGISRRTG